METPLYFLGLIVSVSVIHLATIAVQYLSALSGNRSSKGKELQSESEQRNDWYVFFHCADLLGNQPGRPSSGRPKNGQPAQMVPERRESTQRPRARVRL
jgi:hypothetical protein